MTGEECMEHATTVFIADSAEDFCTGLTAALQRTTGFHVVGTTQDGESAIHAILEKKPDVLVLDLMLPKKDGISVLKAIAEMDRLPAVLATSAFVSTYVSAAAANLGVRYLMQKPCDLGALTSQLAEIHGGEPIRLVPQRRMDKTSIESLVTGIIHEIGVPAHWDDMKIGELNVRRKWKLNILGVREGKMNMDVTNETVLHAGQQMLVLGRYEDLRRIFFRQ
jgi:two-component system response regulator (stage 0 sporulation protein A)